MRRSTIISQVWDLVNSGLVTSIFLDVITVFYTPKWFKGSIYRRSRYERRQVCADLHAMLNRFPPEWTPLTGVARTQKFPRELAKDLCNWSHGSRWRQGQIAKDPPPT